MDDTTAITKQAIAAVAVTDFLGHRDYLAEVYRCIKTALPAYSYLKFATDLGFSATNVIRLIIKGDRTLTTKAASRIAKGLGLHGAELRYWTALVKYGEARRPAERDRLFSLLIGLKTKAKPEALTPTQAAYFGAWYHPVIREMVGLPDFVGDPGWIQERLAFPLRLDEIRRSLELLDQLGVIIRDTVRGHYVKSPVVATSPETDSLALVRYHQKMIEIGGESITRIDAELRQIQAVTVSLPLAAVELLKAKIQALTQDALALEAAAAAAPGAGEEVFQMNIQLFPFTVKRGRTP